jgi:NAD(P)-dependent dehydrogenase (short-subunit alcohol dehydrogenase family)
MTLSGKTAIVTGGGTGIGRAAAIALAQAGAAVAVFDIDSQSAAKVAAEISAAGGRAIAVAADVSSADDIESGVDSAVAAFGPVNVVFNNAGIIRRTTVLDIEPDDWDRVFAVNVRSMYLMCRKVVPIMTAAGGGSIINTGSGWGLKGGGTAVSYCASKGAVVNLTRALAIDHGPVGIRVNCVCPGDVNTGMLRNEAGQLGQDPKAFLAEAADRPLGRYGEPEEIAAAVVWLASDAASYVTGSILSVDGGGNA